MIRKFSVLLAAACLFACSGEQTSAPDPAATAAQTAQPAEQTNTSVQGSGQGEPSAEPQRMSQAERQAALGARHFQEGQDYTRLTPAQPTVETEGDMVEVAEVFQYSCPHCFNFEPYLEAWAENKPDYVNFVRVPAPWNPLSELHARAYYAAQALGIVEQSHEAFFDEFHRNHNYMQTEDELADFYAQFGVDKDTFVSTLNSFAVHTKVQRAKDLIERYRVNGTPGMVVAGKYNVSGTQAQSYDNWFAIIDELAAVEWANAGE